MFVKLRAARYVIAILITLMIAFSIANPFLYTTPPAMAQDINRNDQKSPIFIGVNVRGQYTNLQYERYPDFVFPENYYEDSFRLIRDAGMNLVRYLFYWEAYERNPELFIQELQTVANVADK